MFTGRYKVLIGDVEMIVEANSPLLHEDNENIYMEEDLVCDSCGRKYSTWTLDDPGREAPLNICGKSDCESIAIELDIEE